MVKIRLKRFGKKQQPSYRIVVMNSASNRDGKTIDEIGFYHPLNISNSNQITLDVDKFNQWQQKGAQATDIVKKLFNKAQRA